MTGEKVGRGSYYSLTGTGRRRFEKAFKRVYNSTVSAWDGSWCLVMLTQLTPDKRKQVREELEWQGFGAISPTVLACPRSDRTDLNATLLDLGSHEETIVFETTVKDVVASKTLRLQVRESWNIEELATHYSEFLQLFRPLWQALREQENLQLSECFLARVLLNHECRKLLLATHHYRTSCCPAIGRTGRPAVLSQYYRLIYVKAEEWLNSAPEAAGGPLRDVGESFYRRFGGLK